MEISDFKEIDICNIIKTCAESGVQKFAIGELVIDFQQAGVSAQVWPGMEHTPPNPGTDTEPVNTLELTQVDRELLEELEETQTMMDDPEQFEQNIIDSYLQTNDGVVNEGPRHSQT